MTLSNGKESFSPSSFSFFQKPVSLPKHVAIAMDGNRRWALIRNKPISRGYEKGLETLIKITEAASQMGVKVLTVYAFSTENWNRCEEEKKVVFQLIEKSLIEYRKKLVLAGVRIDTIGELSRLSPSLQESLLQTKRDTIRGEKLKLILALNYGGRDEILRSVKKILQDYDQKLIRREEITEKRFSKYLDTASVQDPDLFIRTSGEKRLSNFLLWQSSYSEFYVTEKLWPDFSKKDFEEALLDYQTRQRRLGAS